MKKSKLIELLSSSDEEYVCVEMNGEIFDIRTECGHLEESFDGFFSAYPAQIVLKLTDETTDEI